MQNLGDLAFSKLSAFFDEIGSPLRGTHRKAIQSFLSVLDQGLQGTLPKAYYLLSLDPGMGKTQACVHFLKAWQERAYQPSSSVLVAVSTLDELQSFIDDANLPKDDFGVLTSDPAKNALGLREALHNQARVLFTTQAMIRRRTKGKLFADAEEFHFDGRPRVLRLWDESILPNEGVVLKRADLFALVDPLRADFRELADCLEAFVSSLGSLHPGSLVRLPVSLRIPTRSVASALTEAKLRRTFDGKR